MVSAERTAATTVRRVGTDGRYSSAEQRLLEEVAPQPEADPELTGPHLIDAGVH